MVGKKHKRLFGFGILEPYPPEMRWIVLARVMPVQRDRLIGDDAGRAVGGGRIHPMSIEVRFRAGYEKAPA